ncbi:MAG: hypothetical protein ACXW18_12490 [Pyrinomonadaceae bacterium]
MTLTTELPEALIRQAAEREIPGEDLKAVAVAAVEIWLARWHSVDGGRFSESAVPFVRRLISGNRELFDALAQR